MPLPDAQPSRHVGSFGAVLGRIEDDPYWVILPAMPPDECEHCTSVCLMCARSWGYDWDITTWNNAPEFYPN